MHVIGYHMQLWSHIHRQCFHNSVDTNNFTESFNNVLKNHYLTLRNDKSVFSLTKILLQCVFPDQEREYTISTARQTTAYRQPRNALPQFLTNRPSSVTSACLVNIEKGKAIEISTIKEEDAVNGVYSVSSKRGMYKVQIQEGSCTCPYFTQSRIPCKHIFSILHNFKWKWEHLPLSLTESPFMTLDNDILQDEHSDLCIVEEDQSTPFTSTAIPLHQTPGSQLLRLQKQLRDELAKCSAAVFMVDDITILENVKRKVHSIHSELLSTSSICDKAEELPILKNLMKEEVSEYRRKAKVIARANQLTRRYKKLKRKSNTGCPIQLKRPRLKDDPLNAATRPSVGRPKSKKADTNKKTNGTGMSHPIYHPYFSSTLCLFMLWLSIILLQETVILCLSTNNWKMHYPRLKATRYLSFHPSSIAGKISLHISVCFAQEMTDLPGSITTSAQSQPKPGTLYIHVGPSN